MTKSKRGDAAGYQRGAKGYGELSKSDREFLRSYSPASDREIYGEPAVGMFPKVTNAHPEGDDV